MVAEMASEELQTQCIVDNVNMEGNCLFSSSALQLGRSSPNVGRSLRAEIVDYIKSHPEMADRYAALHVIRPC